MNWTQIIEVIGGTAVVMGAIAWVARSAISWFFSRNLENLKIDLQLLDLKHQQEKELEDLHNTQQKALADMRAKTDERIEHIRAALDRVERLEAELAKSRSEWYGEIWNLTDFLNLFGPMNDPDIQGLSTRPKDWYFKPGMLLGEDSKQRYFLVQETE